MSAFSSPVGFAGIGAMGEPIALHLAKAGIPLLVWNRSAVKCQPIAQAGAGVASDPDELFTRCRIVFLMLANATATDLVLGRGTASFAGRVCGRLIVNLGTPSPAYSQALESEIKAAGGHYVEAPVSGSRTPAEAGQLVAMLAGEAEAKQEVRPLFDTFCKQAVDCGAVPAALHMKLSINLLLVTMVTGLVEAMHLAERLGLDLAQFTEILGAGPMANSVLRTNAAKLLSRDLSPQASIRIVAENNRLIAAASRGAGAASPMLDACNALYADAELMGLAEEDVVAVLQALEARTEAGS